MHFNDAFEPAAPLAPRPATSHPPQNPIEQAFWRVVRAHGELTRTAEQLQARGKFEAVTGSMGRYIYYRFQWQGQERSLGAEIQSTTGGLQLQKFFAACTKALAGNFEQPDIRPYLPRVHAPLRVR